MKYLKILSLVAVVTFFSSCEEFLKETPPDFLDPEKAYQTEEDIFLALTGAYDALGTGNLDYYKRRFLYMIMFASDEMDPIDLANDRVLHTFEYGADENNINEVFREIYKAINRANVVISRLPEVSDISDASARTFEGEARFLRALSFFNAVRLWGPIPLPLTDTRDLSDAFIERSPIDQVYNAIIADLEFAKDNIPATNQNGRATSGAAKALLAKVYITRASSSVAQSGDYQKCIDLCNEVIDDPNYSLTSDFEKAIGKEDAFNSESIFEFITDRGIKTEENSVFPAFVLPLTTPGIVSYPQVNASYVRGAGLGTADIVSEELYFEMFDPRDYRREQTFLYYGLDADGDTLDYTSFIRPFPHAPQKFVDASRPDNFLFYAFSMNVVILRLADVYLMKAEAINELSGPNEEAYAAINAVRKRARDGDGDGPWVETGYPEDLSGLSKDEFRDAVLEERAIELAFEGHRWFDLARTDRLIQVLGNEQGKPIQERHKLFPIPVSQIQLLGSKLEQNDGW